MSLQPLIPLVVLILLASVVGLTVGAAQASEPISTISGLVFAAAISATALFINWPLWTKDPAQLDAIERVHAVRRNTRLVALVYAWAAAGILAAYTLTDLKWYHAWQYGLGAALIAGALLVLVKRMGPPKNAPPPKLEWTWLHAGTVAAGLVYLMASGKLMNPRSDWLANVVFLWGGVALIAVCLVSARTQAHLEQRGDEA